jgi:hypothetical protein
MVQMPALNTPQFSWVKSRLPRKPQPVPPVFQPEVAAEAIVWAAHQNRREVYVGGPTVKAILGNKNAPRFADRYLARNGYEARNKPASRRRIAPTIFGCRLKGDHGAHGAFDASSRAVSWQFWIRGKRTWLALTGLAIAGTLLAGKR